MREKVRSIGVSLFLLVIDYFLLVFISLGIVISLRTASRMIVLLYELVEISNVSMLKFQVNILGLFLLLFFLIRAFKFFPLFVRRNELRVVEEWVTSRHGFPWNLLYVLFLLIVTLAFTVLGLSWGAW